MDRPDLNNCTDADLVLRYKDTADDGAFRELYSRYRGRLMAYAGRLLKDPDDAQDVVHEAFVQVFKRIQELRNPEQFRAWLYRTVHNTALNYLRRSRRMVRPAESAPEMADDRVDVAGSVERSELAGFIESAVTEASEKVREIALLRLQQGLTFEEISTTTGVPLRTVKYRMKGFLDGLNARLMEAGLLK